jgi:hypothetical protein
MLRSISLQFNIPQSPYTIILITLSVSPCSRDGNIFVLKLCTRKKYARIKNRGLNENNILLHGTMLQAGRLQVPFPMRLPDFSTDLILQLHYGPGLHLAF